MKIAIISQYFYPEEFKINDLAKEFVNRGHSVIVITGKPNYPSGNYAEGYSFKGVIEEEYEGINIYRVPLIRRGKGGPIRLSLNYLSFVHYATRFIKKQNINVDVVFCFETSPITQMLPAIRLSKKIGVKSAMWVQDLWPESVVATGNASDGGLFVKLLNKLVRHIYDKTNVLFISSQGFQSSITSKGDYNDKIVYAPNWAEDLYTQSDKIDFHKYKEKIPDGFVVMFAGNLGVAQDLENVLLAAELTKKNGKIKWVFVGDGRNREVLEKRTRELGLEETVFFLGRFPAEEMPSFFVHADAMLMSLRDEGIFRLTVPSKTQTYMASGKPILSMVSGEANDLIKEAECGLIAESSDYKSLADNVIKMSRLSKEELAEMGENGKSYYNSHFSKDTVVSRILEHLERISNGNQ